VRGGSRENITYIAIESLHSTAETSNPTQRAGDSIDRSSDLGEPVRDFSTGSPTPAQTVAGLFDGSPDSIDEDARSTQTIGHSVEEDSRAVQKAVDACQRVHCIKRFIRLTF
jgi:hypothetical protein